MSEFFARWKDKLAEWLNARSPFREQFSRGLPTIREPDERVTELLIRLSEWADKTPSDSVSLGEVMYQLRRCGFGIGLLIFTLPSCIPMPPGFTTFSGLGLGIVAWQMVMARSSLQVPMFLGRRRISPGAVRKAVQLLLPALGRFEHLCKPRLTFFGSPQARAVIGVALLLLAMILMLPLPFMNMPPAVAASLMAIGLTENDGVLILIGLCLTVLIVLFLVVVILAAIFGGFGVLAWLPALF